MIKFKSMNSIKADFKDLLIDGPISILDSLVSFVFFLVISIIAFSMVNSNLLNKTFLESIISESQAPNSISILTYFVFTMASVISILKSPFEKRNTFLLNITINIKAKLLFGMVSALAGINLAKYIINGFLVPKCIDSVTILINVNHPFYLAAIALFAPIVFNCIMPPTTFINNSPKLNMNAIRILVMLLLFFLLLSDVARFLYGAPQCLTTT